MFNLTENASVAVLNIRRKCREKLYFNAYISFQTVEPNLKEANSSSGKYLKCHAKLCRTLCVIHPMKRYVR